ncbi:hypothetical protein C6T52_29010 [Burkholderia multivorans]|nr:hypothetical protein C6T52_29010 [Burkholderia multivorans]
MRSAARRWGPISGRSRRIAVSPRAILYIRRRVSRTVTVRLRPPYQAAGGAPCTRTRRIGCAPRAIRRNRLRARAKSTRIAQFGFR